MEHGEARFNRPIFCYDSYSGKDHVMRNLGFEESQEDPHLMDGGHLRIKIEKWINDANQTFLYTCVVRVITLDEWIDYLQFIRNLFPAIFVLNCELDQENVTPLGPKFKLNPSIDDIQRVCGFILSDVQKANHRRIVTYNDARPPSAREMMMNVMRTQQEQVDELEMIFHPLMQEQPLDDDRFLRMAIRMSQEEEARRREALENAKQKLQDGWEEVLKKSTPKKKGRPVCIVCLVSEATICLVECGHQVMCDECVREIWTRSSLKKACPVCQTECTMITRPIWSVEANEEEEEEEELPKRKKKKT